MYVGNADFDTRNAVAKSMAAEAGIRLPNTIVPEGESLLPIGEENKRRLATDIALLPSLADGIAALRARMAMEKKVDTVVPVQRIRMNPKNGALGESADKANLGYTAEGFNHVAHFIKPDSVRSGFNSTLLALPPAIRADAFNYFAGNAIESDKAVLRTIINPESGRRIIRAVTSEKHSLESGDDSMIARVLEESLPAGAKLRVTRTMTRTDFEIIWPALQRQLRVGDIALIALSIANSETKAGSLRIWPKLLRVLCYNFTTAWSSGADEEISLRHIGDLKWKLPAAFKKALAVVEPFVVAFGDAYQLALPDFAPTRGEALSRVVSKLGIPESVAEEAATLWDADGEKSAGNTLAGLVNAITRASQELSMAESAGVEKMAGQLIANGWDVLN